MTAPLAADRVAFILRLARAMHRAGYAATASRRCSA